MQASLDEPTRTIVLHHAKPNKLQCRTLLLAEKVYYTHSLCIYIESYGCVCRVQISTLADHNEELMKLKHAGPWSKCWCKWYLHNAHWKRIVYFIVKYVHIYVQYICAVVYFAGLLFSCLSRACVRACVCVCAGVQNQNAPFSRHPHSNWQNKYRRGQHSHR